MKCPKCASENPEGSLFCSLCHENFKPKAPRKSTRITIKEVHASFEGWVFTGPFVATENGLYVFVKHCQNPTDNKEGIGLAIGKQFGLAGAVVGAVIDSQLDDKHSIIRPDKLEFQPTRNIIDQCQDSLDEAPGIPSCKDYLVIRKDEIKAMSYSMLSNLNIKTQYSELEVSGVEPVVRATAFFAKFGYPIER